MTPAPGIDPTALPPTRGPLTGGLISCVLRAPRAFESFVHLFKGGGVQGRSPCPRSAERGIPLCFIKRRRGFEGEPSPGVPPFSLLFCVCAVLLGGVVALSCHSTPFLWCLPKETVSSRQRKAPFLPRQLHHSRERYCLGRRDVPRPTLGRAWCLSVAFYVCAVLLGSVLWPLLPIPPHFFALAQRNGVEPQRNALKGAATGAIRSRPPLPRT